MIKHNYPGKFIVIEGLDGSGKGSQVNLLVDFLKNEGRQIVATREPALDSESGRKIKQVLRKEIVIDDPMEIQKLYVQDRKEHLENKVIPALVSGSCVISDRYAFTGFSYVAAGGGNMQALIDLQSNIPLPDLTVIIDVSAETCLKRIESRGQKKEYFEELEKLKKARAFYQQFPTMFPNTFLVNGELSIAEVFGEIKSLVNKVL